MDKNIIPVLIVVLLSIAGVVGDFFIKLSGNTKKFIEPKTFLIGFIIYSSTAFGWLYVMKHVKLATLGVIYSLTTVMLLVLVGVFYFNDPLNWSEIVGILAAVASLLLLSRFAG
jgi:small multidrug resistance pump